MCRQYYNYLHFNITLLGVTNKYNLNRSMRKFHQSSCPMWMEKGFQKYIGTVSREEVGTLQGPDSDVILHIPGSVNGVIIGCVHTNLSEFVGVIPEEECIIAPMTEYHYYPFKGEETLKEQKFIINIPHCLPEESQWDDVKVRMGDSKFVTIERLNESTQQETYFTVDENFIAISTSHFSKICPSCRQHCCYDKAILLVFGSLQPLPISAASVRPFFCGIHYNIEDYRQVFFCCYSKNSRIV